MRQQFSDLACQRLPTLEAVRDGACRARAVGKLRIRFDRYLDIHIAMFFLAAAVICSQFIDDLC
ncbi:hypothetical protein DF046_12050 [Burkholderia cepacia]|nr:hypothetical protein DF046_12050 [Burkholderia cepacia]